MKIYFDKKRCLFLFGIAVFMLNSVCRDSFMNLFGLQLPRILAAPNLLAIACLLLIIYIGIYDSLYSYQYALAALVTIYTVIVFVSDLGGDKAYTTNVGQYVLWTSILPALALMLPDYENVDFRSLLSLFTAAYDIIFIPILCLGIADFFMGGVINNFLAVHMSSVVWAAMIRLQNSIYGFRMCTIMGAPLMNAFYAMVLMVLNRVYWEVFHKTLVNRFLIYAIGIVAIALTGSRAALIIAVVYILVIELTGRMGLMRVFPIVALFIIFFNTEAFQQTVGARFKLGFTSANEARYKLWQAFIGNEYGGVRLFAGGGYNYSRWLTSNMLNTTMNFEYPALMFLYDYGILATVIYYLLTGVIPLAVMVTKEKYGMAFGYLVLFAFLQTFNCLAQFYDMNMELMFLAILFCGLAMMGRGKAPALPEANPEEGK